MIFLNILKQAVYNKKLFCMNSIVYFYIDNAFINYLNFIDSSN